MSKASRTSCMILCAALAACSDNGDTNRIVTAPDGGPAFSEAPADLRGAATVDGPFDLVFGSGSASTPQAAAASPAATGGRASGRVAFTLNPPWFGVASEQYSFVALGTNAPTPFAARGEYDMTLTTATGVVQKFRGLVICMNIVGNQARIAGRLTKVWINDVPRPINPRASHNIWNVTDNGEGQGTTDTASPMIFFPGDIAPRHCATDFIPPQFPNQVGDIQVRP